MPELQLQHAIDEQLKYKNMKPFLNVELPSCVEDLEPEIEIHEEVDESIQGDKGSNMEMDNGNNSIAKTPRRTKKSLQPDHSQILRQCDVCDVSHVFDKIT